MYQSMQPLVIDGTSGDGTLVSGLDSPPYRIFDPDTQEYLTGDMEARRDAERTLTMLGRALNRPVCREVSSDLKGNRLALRLKAMRRAMLLKHGECASIPQAAVACSDSTLRLNEAYYDLLASLPNVTAPPMWIGIAPGPYGRYTAYLLPARLFFVRNGITYWDAVPNHSMLIRYLEDKGLCPWQVLNP